MNSSNACSHMLCCTLNTQSLHTSPSWPVVHKKHQPVSTQTALPVRSVCVRTYPAVCRQTFTPSQPPVTWSLAHRRTATHVRGHHSFSSSVYLSKCLGGSTAQPSSPCPPFPPSFCLPSLPSLFLPLLCFLLISLLFSFLSFFFIFTFNSPSFSSSHPHPHHWILPQVCLFCMQARISLLILSMLLCLHLSSLLEFGKHACIHLFLIGVRLLTLLFNFPMNRVARHAEFQDEKFCLCNYSLLIFSTEAVFAVGGWYCYLMPITVQTKKEARGAFEQACSDLGINHVELTVKTYLSRSCNLGCCSWSRQDLVCQ